MYNQEYKNQFSLLIEILPCLKEQNYFAIKGGTAINLFYRNFPRISVDIDLTYTPLHDRDLTIKNMNDTLSQMAIYIAKRVPNAKINQRLSRNGEYILKLMVSNGKSIVKIEPNYIFRGAVCGIKKLPLSERVTQEFGGFIDGIPVMSFNDVFAGKICAALNRQHPRDLFDVKLLLENEGITDELRQTFVIYLACDSRPINELLNPNLKDISSLYIKEFNRMASEEISIDSLINARERLIKEVVGGLTHNEKNFLISVKKGDPDYTMMPFTDLDKLPALQWKIQNVRKMSKDKHQKMLSKLMAILD
jgi:predicted nucleotidyltransferase component of viral defense system